MKEIKFRVYYEAELNGEKMKGIEETCSWFLLTQTGQIMEYGPMRPPQKPNKNYTKLIPLFFTGLLDKNGVEIYENDLLKDPQGNIGRVFYNSKSASYLINWKQKDGTYDTDNCLGYGEVIGNIYSNPDLLKESTND